MLDNFKRMLGVAFFGAALFLGLGSVAAVPAATVGMGCETDPYCHLMPHACATGCCGGTCDTMSQFCCLPGVDPEG